MLIGADFSSIESRVLAWVAGEEWKLDGYRRFDATRDPRDEPYCETACKIFRVPAGSFTKNSPERGVGKTCDLAFGYSGRLGAWRKFEPDKFTDAEVETFKTEWRAAHPAIKRFWYDIDRAAWTAVRERGRVVRCGRVDFKMRRRVPAAEAADRPQDLLSAAAHHWRRARTVVLCSPTTPPASSRIAATVRAPMAAYGPRTSSPASPAICWPTAMLRVEAAGYPIVLHVHDEIVCRGAGRLRQHRRIHPSDDAQAGLGAGAADRSQCLDRAALLQMRRRTVRIG